MEYLLYYCMKVDSYSSVGIKWVKNFLKHFIIEGINFIPFNFIYYYK